MHVYIAISPICVYVFFFSKCLISFTPKVLSNYVFISVFMYEFVIILICVYVSVCPYMFVWL